jgi:tetratricopeptide (TPR) repeat protein
MRIAEASSLKLYFSDIIRMMNKFRLSVFLLVFGLSSGFFSGLAAAESTPVILGEISRLLSEFRYGDAIALFDTIDPADAKTISIRLLKASVLNSAGLGAEARVIVESVSREEPNNLEALFVLSAIEGAAGKVREQRALLERIVKADPGNVEALIDLATLYMEAGSLKNATQYFDQALALEPENLGALLGRARIHRLNREPKSAENLYNKAVTLYPQESSVWHDRARLYRGAGYPNLALKDLDKAKELAPRDYWIAIDRGNVFLDMGSKEPALAEYQRAISLDPNEFLAYAYTAGIKDDLGDFSGAGKDYEILAKLKPDYPYAFEGLGFHMMKDGQWAAARDAFAETYRQLSDDWCYALLAAINWMKAADVTGPRQFLNQAMAKVKRDTMEYYLIRLYYDMAGRVYAGENDMLQRVDKEKNIVTKARMVFYLGHYFDIRGNQTLANKYFTQFRDMDCQTLPEWRLNQWIMEDRGLAGF